MTAFQPGRSGLGTVAQGVVILTVFAIVLTGMLVMARREAAVAEFAEASARAEAAAAEPSDPPAPPDSETTPVPAPDAAGPGTYTVQLGDSLFSVASALGVGPNELIYWNKETYPTMQSTPALQPGWVLVTDGPPLPTPLPDRPPQPTTPPPQIAGPNGVTLPVFGPGHFPASGAVTVGYYTVTGATPWEILQSMAANGPWDAWIGGRADAQVQVSPSFEFRFEDDGLGACRIVKLDATPVGATYHVTLPGWAAPPDASASTVEWWIQVINATVTHEAHHVTLYESFLPAMNSAVLNGTCESAEADLLRLWTEAHRVNCEFDFEEYGAAAGLTVEDCVDA